MTLPLPAEVEVPGMWTSAPFAEPVVTLSHAASFPRPSLDGWSSPGFPDRSVRAGEGPHLLRGERLISVRSVFVSWQLSRLVSLLRL